MRSLLALPLLVCLSVAMAQDDDTAAPLPDPSGLQLASIHAVVAALDSGDVLYRKRADQAVPIASITKLMTAMVVLDSGEPLDEWLTIPERREPPPNNGYSRMRVGSQLPRGELIRLALMASENLAAYTLARHHPGGLEAFVAAMNAKAAELGMSQSHFVGPSGLSTGNRSSASDLLKMIKAAAGYERIRHYTQSTLHVAHFRNPSYTLRYGNTNVLVYRNRWDVELTKTGYLDEAGRCLVMMTEIDGRRIGMVLLDSFGSRTPVGDAGRIRQWLATGRSGPIAKAALRYERRKAARFEQASNTR